MSKALLLSIKPKYVAKILNGEKTIEIRKTCPQVFKHLKPYEGCSIDVYIYCTKDKKYANLINRGGFLTGMVVAKFTLNKVEEISLNRGHFVNDQYSTDNLDWQELLEKSCLSYKELDNYLQCEIGYAWYIDNLVIFDKPKELSEFKPFNNGMPQYKFIKNGCEDIKLIKAPQSYIFIESENEND